MHDVLQMLAEFQKFLGVVLVLVLVLLVQEHDVEVASIDPLQVVLKAKGNVHDVENQLTDHLLLVEQLHLQHLDELILAE